MFRASSGLRRSWAGHFTEEEQQSDACVAILSYGLWTRRFGRDANIIGQKIQLNGEPFQIIGIMPVKYRCPSANFELWIPLYIPPDEFRHGMNSQYLCVARLRAGGAPDRAQDELSTMMQRLAEMYPVAYRVDNRSVGALVQPPSESDAVRFVRRSTSCLERRLSHADRLHESGRTPDCKSDERQKWRCESPSERVASGCVASCSRKQSRCAPQGP
jgi:hypothetical protein